MRNTKRALALFLSLLMAFSCIATLSFSVAAEDENGEPAGDATVAEAGENTAAAGDDTAGAGDDTAGAGDDTAGAGDDTAGAGDDTAAGGEEETAPTPGVFYDATKLNNFDKDLNSRYVSGNSQMVTTTFNEDGSITFAATWALPVAETLAEGETGEVLEPTPLLLDPYLTIQYANILRSKETYKGSLTQNEFPNTSGEYSVVVFKVKADASVLGDSVLYYSMGMKNIESGANLIYPSYEGDGADDYQYIIFDLSMMSDFMGTSATSARDKIIGQLRLHWLDSQVAAEDNLGAELTLYEMALYTSVEEAESACGLVIPETTKAPETTRKPKTTKADPETTAEPTADDGTEAPAEESGCASVVGSTAVVALIAVAGASAVVISKKKKDEE